MLTKSKKFHKDIRTYVLEPINTSNLSSFLTTNLTKISLYVRYRLETEYPSHSAKIGVLCFRWHVTYFVIRPSGRTRERKHKRVSSGYLHVDCLSSSSTKYLKGRRRLYASIARTCDALTIIYRLNYIMYHAYWGLVLSRTIICV